jgi:cell division protein FtsZ
MINIRMHPKEVQKLSPKIIVVGVGGAGGNAVNNMIGAGLDGVEFLVCNTDSQALDRSYCENKLQLGTSVTGGLGAGAKPEVGREAAEESIEEVLRYLEGANMAFVTAGMGGGTGTGAAPIIARAAREKGILTVGVVTKPFHFEGSYRMKMAEAGIEQMQDYVDTLIVIPNQNLFRIANEKTTFAEAFRMADSVLQSAVRGVTDLMIRPGDVNLDFADIRSVMLEMGKAMMGTGEATGEDRAERAAEAAINNPLLDDVSMKGARGVIINVTGGQDMTLFEVDQACNRIASEVDPNANIIFGSSFDESLEGVLRVSVVATGIDAVEEKVRKPSGSRGWNASTSERRMERTVPNAESIAPVQHQAAPVAYSQPVAPPVHQPAQGFVSRAAAAPVQPRKLVEPAVDMFDAAYMGDVAGKKPEAASAAEPAALRGTVYNDAFIPPKAIEVDRPRPEINYGPQFGNQAGISARRETVEFTETTTTVTATPGFLRPPSQPVQKSRTASLIDRITGSLRHHEEPAEVQHIHEPASQASAPARAEAPVLQGSSQAPLRAPSRPELQGSLAIDVPSIKPDQSIDDELDIPAFLRRQAN